MIKLCVVLIIVFVTLGECEVNSEPSASKLQTEDSCEHFVYLEQPVRSEDSNVRKCCSNKGNLHAFENGTYYKCGDLSYQFNVTVTVVSLYDGCITLNGTDPPLPINIVGLHSSCTYLSENYGTYLIQNGSVLVARTFGYFSYQLHDSYCVDINAQNGAPMICLGPPEDTSNDTGRHIIITAILILSIVCLGVVAVMHFFIKNFHTLHGFCVGLLLLCFAVELTLQCITLLLCEDTARAIRGAVQYFTIVRCLWILITFLNIALAAWLFIPCNIVQWKPHKAILITIYTIICMLIPIFINVQIYEYGPMKFCEIISSPYSITIYVCIVLIIVAYFGIRRLNNVGAYVTTCYKPIKSMRTYIFLQVVEEAGRNLMCLVILISLMLITRVLNGVALWFPSHESLILWNSLLNSLQGVFFATTFLILHPKTDFD